MLMECVLPPRLPASQPSRLFQPFTDIHRFLKNHRQTVAHLFGPPCISRTEYAQSAPPVGRTDAASVCLGPVGPKLSPMRSVDRFCAVWTYNNRTAASGRRTDSEMLSAGHGARAGIVYPVRSVLGRFLHLHCSLRQDSSRLIFHSLKTIVKRNYAKSSCT